MGQTWGRVRGEERVSCFFFSVFGFDLCQLVSPFEPALPVEETGTHAEEGVLFLSMWPICKLLRPGLSISRRSSPS